MTTDTPATALRRYMMLCEATPTEAMRATRYYHGTSTTKAAEAILSTGLQGVATQMRGHLAPVAGRVYLTPHLRYAIIYALGGDYSHAMREGYSPDGPIDPLGYVFVVEGHDLQDVQPDEDSVGEFLNHNSKPIQEPWKKRDGSVAMQSDGEPYMRTVGYRCAMDQNDKTGCQIYYWLRDQVTEKQFERIANGWYAYFAAGGKRALKQMPDWMKIELINRGAHVAHGGVIRPSECWRIVKSQLNELKRDGSNFFQIAERIR
jgi:hypothetical protein